MSRFRFLIVGLVLLLGALFFWSKNSTSRVTASAISPDGRFKVWLVETPHWMDRNFEVRFGTSNQSFRKSHVVFVSPDEGRPIGTERFVWSSDSRMVVLIGKHFFTPEASLLSNGERIYLLYEVETGKIWCNASQVSGLPRFGSSELSAAHFGGIPKFKEGSRK